MVSYTGVARVNVSSDAAERRDVMSEFYFRAHLPSSNDGEPKGTRLTRVQGTFDSAIVCVKKDPNQRYFLTPCPKAPWHLSVHMDD